MIKQILSLQNPIIKLIASLAAKKGRTHQNLFIAEGIRTCSTLIESGMEPQWVLTTKEMIPQLPVEHLAYDPIVTTDEIMKKISCATTPSNLLMVFAIPEPKETLEGGMVLYNLQDPGNVGTLIRTSAALGTKTIVLIEGTDPWAPKVVQASAGTIGMVNIHQMTWNELLIAKQDCQLWALVATEGTPIHSMGQKQTKTLLVVGNEANGIPQKRLADCDQLVTLPMPGNVESLNAAVAGSIALYLTCNS